VAQGFGPSARVRRLGAAFRLTIATGSMFAILAFVHVASAAASADILILDSTVTGGSSSVEATQGLTADVVTPAQWSSMTTAQFAAYRAVVLGDPSCVEDPSPVAAAVANQSVWGPAITGRVVILGTDPVFHKGTAGAVTLISAGLHFAASLPGRTGLYVSLSCYYHAAGAGTPVPLLDPLGSFTVEGQAGCPNAAHIVGTVPFLSSLTDADLSGWGCSTHEGFDAWPSSFQVFAINTDQPSSFVAPDGTTGIPYIVTREGVARPVLDHFTCYDAKGALLHHRHPVLLRDQFEREWVVLGQPTSLCNPASTLQMKAVHPRAHLTCYRIRDAKRDPNGGDDARRTVVVTNEFGKQRLIVTRALALCLPSSKSLTHRNPGPPPRHLDHFKCYAASGHPLHPKGMVVLDEFGKRRMIVEQPVELCNPVSKNHGRILHPRAHLVCYAARPRTFIGRTVTVRHQFGRERLGVGAFSMYCVPSHKRLILPDLTVAIPHTRIPVSCTGTPVKCTTTVKFTISNVGAAPVAAGTSFDVLLEADPNLSVSKTVAITIPASGLPPGGSLPMQAVALPPGASCFDPDCTVQATVDSGHVVPESNEANNTDTFTEVG